MEATESDNAMEFDGQDDSTGPEEFEEDTAGSFENDVDINEEFHAGRGRGRGGFRFVDVCFVE